MRTKVFETSAKQTRYKPSSAATLDSVPCSPGCLQASSVLPGYPTLVVTFFDYLPRTLAHMNAVLPSAL